MSKKEIWLLSTTCLLLGIVLGFFLAPMKNGVSISCGNNNVISEAQKKKCTDNKEEVKTSKVVSMGRKWVPERLEK